MTTRVGIFVEGLSLPTKEGIAKHCIEMAYFLAARPQFEPVLIIVDRGRASVAALRELPFDTLLVAESTYYDVEEVTRLIRTHRIDIVQNYNPHYVTTTLAPAARSLEVPCIYEVHDLEADLNFMNSDASATEYNVATQHKALSAATLSRVMSASDYAVLEKESSYRMRWIPVGMKQQQLERNPVTNRVIFIGNASYPPNMESCRYIIDTLAPLMPEKEFHLIGRMTDTLTGGKNVIAHGEVDDLTPWLATAECGIAPTLHGSGMKIKLLTYLSAGIPCIATTVAASGYSASDAIQVADTPEAIVKAFDHLADGQTAHRYFTDHFDIETLSAHLEAFYQDALASKYVWPEVDGGTFDLARLHWLKEDANQSFTPAVDFELYLRGRHHTHAPLIVLEGLPGAGKTTLFKTLKEHLGKNVQFIEELVINTADETDETYRKNDTMKCLRSLTAGEDIGATIMDRNYVSNLAYTYAKAETDSQYEKVHEETEAWCARALSKGLLRQPDLYVVLELSPEQSIKRRHSNKEHWGDERFSAAVFRYYDLYFKDTPETKILHIDSTLPPETIRNKLITSPLFTNLIATSKKEEKHVPTRV